MSEGKQREEWGRLASWMSLFANCNREPKSQPYSPTHFNPFPSGPHRKLTATERVKQITSLFGAGE